MAGILEAEPRKLETEPDKEMQDFMKKHPGDFQKYRGALWMWDDTVDEWVVLTETLN